MKCKTCRDSIIAYIQKEIDGEDRISISQHLKSCDTCREHYLMQLRLYYSLARQEVLSSPAEVDDSFRRSILKRIKSSGEAGQHTGRLWIWYAAAAILITGVLIGRFIAPFQHERAPDKKRVSISSLVEAEDWPQLQKILEDQEAVAKYAGEEINIRLLLDKLVKLQENRRHVPATDISSGFNISAPDSSISNARIEISVENFIYLLKQVQRQKNHISIMEVTSILNNI